MVAAIAGEIGVVLPAQSEVECEVRSHAPIILRIEGGVVVAHVRDRDGHDRRGAVDADGDWNVEIVDDTVAIQILKAEVGGQDDGAGAKHVDQAMRGSAETRRRGEGRACQRPW